jgi:predicted RNase H-like HicB family nuclease
MFTDDEALRWRNQEEDATVRQVVIYPGEDGYWVAECPSLPGCVSQGTTKEEAIANIREAIHEYVAALEEDKGALASSPADVAASRASTLVPPPNC